MWSNLFFYDCWLVHGGGLLCAPKSIQLFCMVAMSFEFGAKKNNDVHPIMALDWKSKSL